jgi:hypothetical protein
MMRSLARFGFTAGAVAVLAPGAHAAPVQFDANVPTLDRWVYTFGGSPGTEAEATVFSVLGSGFEGPEPAFPNAPVFDIRDGQFLVGFDTSPTVAAGRPLNNYRILSARVFATISRDKVFRYDPTPDPFNCYLPAGDPNFVADPDPDHPVEIYPVGYRYGFTTATYAENTPFNPFGSPGRKSVRSAYAAQYENANGTGALIDVSNNVQELPTQPRFESRPFAIGTCPATPGDLVDVGTEFTFDINLNDPGAIRYLRESLSGGRLNLMISSLTVTNQQSSTTPAFWTKEGSPVLGAVPPRLSLTVCVGAPADWNCSGDVTVQDIFDFLASYFTNTGDFNADGGTSVQDIFDFLSAYFAG